MKSKTKNTKTVKVVDLPRPKFSAGWPDGVPILSADQLCWSFTSQDGRKDLAYWLEHTFDVNYNGRSSGFRKAYRTLRTVLAERTGKRISSLWAFLEKAHCDKAPDLVWQAACWNEAMDRLGYAVDALDRADPSL